MRKKKTISARDLPATLGMLHEVRDELKADLRSAQHSLEAKISGVRLDLSAQLEKNTAAIHQMRLLMEEQRAENRFVMEGLNSLFSCQERIENEVEDVKTTVFKSK